MKKALVFLSEVAFVVCVSLWAGQAGAVSEWIPCDPDIIVTYETRIHVRCVASIGGVQYYARNTSNKADAARFMNTLTAAQVAGRTLQILTDFNDTSGVSFGCAASDCRLLKAVGFGD